MRLRRNRNSTNQVSAMLSVYLSAPLQLTERLAIQELTSENAVFLEENAKAMRRYLDNLQDIIVPPRRVEGVEP